MSVKTEAFILNLDTVQSGNPKKVRMSCVYTWVVDKTMGSAAVTAIDDTLVNFTMFTLGLEGQWAFMNTDKTVVELDSGPLVVYRVGFGIDNKTNDKSGYMMQGNDGDDVVATKGMNVQLKDHFGVDMATDATGN